MRVLVLGGTHHVGRAVAETALDRGDDVTTLNRGLTGHAVPGARHVRADRTDPGQLRAALEGRTFDAVVDTWSAQPRVVRDAAELLAGRAGHYGYVSSESVYTWPAPPGADESYPVVAADPGSGSGEDYAAAKRGGEIAAQDGFGGPVLFARAGLILGPYEIVGRMPWWLRRIERGGDVLAPGPRDLPLQFIDCRDLAAWMLRAAEKGLAGPYNTVSRPGHATMESLLRTAIEVTGSDARLVWADPETIAAAGIEPWTELPIWAPPVGELAGLHASDVSAAHRAGLTCRPVRETIADTWDWLRAEGDPPARPGRPRHGIDLEKERKLLASLAG